MGHRSNTVIIDDNQIYVEGSHWGALGILDCLLSGPRNFVPSDSAAPNEDYPSDGLYDSTWCEGFVCVDNDTRTVLFDSGQSNTGRDLLKGHFLYQGILKAWSDWSVWFVGPGVGSGVDTIEREVMETLSIY